MNFIMMKNKLFIFIILTLLIQYGCKNHNVSVEPPKDMAEVFCKGYLDVEIESFIPLYTKKINEGDSSFCLLRGCCYLLLRENTKAIKDFYAILKKDSSNSNALLGVGYSFVATKLDSARYYFNKVIQQDTNNAFAYLFRWQYQLDTLNRFEDINKAIKLKPDYALFYTERGIRYMLVDSIKLGLDDFNHSVKLNPSLPNNYIFLGLYNSFKKKYKEALNCYSQVIKLSPNNPQSYENRGETYYELQMYQNAIQDYKKALDLADNSILSSLKSNISYKIARNYSLLKNDSALIYLKLAFKYDDDNDKYNNAYFAKREKDFDNIKDTEEFKDLIRKYGKDN